MKAERRIGAQDLAAVMEKAGRLVKKHFGPGTRPIGAPGCGQAEPAMVLNVNGEGLSSDLASLDPGPVAEGVFQLGAPSGLGISTVDYWGRVSLPQLAVPQQAFFNPMLAFAQGRLPESVSLTVNVGTQTVVVKVPFDGNEQAFSRPIPLMLNGPVTGNPVKAGEFMASPLFFDKPSGWSLSVSEEALPPDLCQFLTPSSSIKLSLSIWAGLTPREWTAVSAYRFALYPGIESRRVSGVDSWELTGLGWYGQLTLLDVKWEGEVAAAGK